MGEDREYLPSHDALDLYELWFIIWKRKRIVLIVAFFIFSAAGVFAYLLPDVYKVKNTIVLPQISKDQISKELINAYEVQSIVKALNELSTKQKEKELRLPVDNLRSIKGISSLNIAGTNTIKIEIDTLDRDAGVRLIDVLPGYIMTRPYILRRIETQKDLLKRNKAELKKIIDDPRGSLGLPASQSVIYGPLLDIYSYTEKYNQLNSDLNQLEYNQLIMLADATVIPEKPYKPKRKLILLLGLFTGIIMGLFFVSFTEWARNAKRQDEDL